MPYNRDTTWVTIQTEFYTQRKMNVVNDKPEYEC